MAMRWMDLFMLMQVVVTPPYSYQWNLGVTGDSAVQLTDEESYAVDCN